MTWDSTCPNDETFMFFGELIERLSAPTRRKALAHLERVGAHGSATARTNVFAYTLRALEKGVPYPRPRTLNLSDTDLRGWNIGSEQMHVDLSGVVLTGARLDDAHIRHVLLDRADAAGASMRRTLLEHCTLTQANLEEADLAGTIFRQCDMEGVPLDKATRYRTQLLHTVGYQRELSDTLTAPLSEQDPLRVLPEAQILGGHSSWVSAVAWSPDGHHILTASDDGTARIWDATTGEQVRFFIAVLPEGECAVLTPDQTRVIGASPSAWRWLGRYAVHPDGTLERIPAEIDGPLPPLGPGAQTE